MHMIKSDRLFDELRRGEVYPVYLLLGEENTGKEEFILLLKETVLGGDENNAGNVFIIYGDETGPKDVVENLTTYALFGGKKIVIVRDFDRMISSGPVLEYAESPNEDSVLVLLSQKKSLSGKIMDAAGKKGRVCVFWRMFPNAGVQWLKSRFAGLGVDADPDAIEYIIDLSGTDRSVLESQVAGVSNYLEKGERLTVERAADIVSRLYEYTVFDLTGAFFTRGPARITALFRHLVENGEDMVKILFFCTREIGKLADVCALHAQGNSFSKIEKTLGLRKMESSRLRKAADRVSPGFFRFLYRELAALEKTLKSSPPIQGRVEFERFLLHLCAR